MGISDSLNSSGNETFNAYMHGFQEAFRFLKENNIDTSSIDIKKFMTSYAKQSIVLSMNNTELWRAAFKDKLDAINPPKDINGKVIQTADRSLSLDVYIHLKNIKEEKSNNLIEDAAYDFIDFIKLAVLNGINTNITFTRNLSFRGSYYLTHIMIIT